VDEDDLEFVSGEAVEYVKMGESGNKRVQAFCGSCGTGLYATSAGEGPRVYGLRVGTSRQREKLVPKRQAWIRSQCHWLSDLESIPGTETQ
jgi:hypothetical protein